MERQPSQIQSEVIASLGVKAQARTVAAREALAGENPSRKRIRFAVRQLELADEALGRADELRNPTPSYPGPHVDSIARLLKYIAPTPKRNVRNRTEA